MFYLKAFQGGVFTSIMLEEDRNLAVTVREQSVQNAKTVTIRVFSVVRLLIQIQLA